MEIIRTQSRPWGKYDVLMEDYCVQVKKLYVNDMHRISLQSHEDRDEYWFITAGQGILEIDGTRHEVHAGMQFSIMRGEKHRVQALACTLEILEVQHGHNLSEDDITRYEDDYGR